MSNTPLTWTQDGGRITALGEIDLYSAPRLKIAIDACVAAGSHEVCLDLTGVDFCDSSGFVVLLRTGQKMRAEQRVFRVRVRKGGQVERNLYLGRLAPYMLLESVESANALGGGEVESEAESELAEIELHEGLLE